MVTFDLPGYDVRYMELSNDVCPVIDCIALQSMVQWCVFGVLQRIVSDLAMYNDGRGIQLDLLDSY